MTLAHLHETSLDMSHEKVHPPPEKGIWGDEDGARSIVISGGYEDDRDMGETMWATVA